MVSRKPHPYIPVTAKLALSPCQLRQANQNSWLYATGGTNKTSAGNAQRALPAPERMGNIADGVLQDVIIRSSLYCGASVMLFFHISKSSSGLFIFSQPFFVIWV
jgi:hypothetical protein